MQTQTPPTPPTLTLDDYRALLAWALSGDTGLSSETMVARMSGLGVDTVWGPRYPLDLDDFGRCYRLLQRVPSLRSRLPLMADVSPVWAALVKHWGEIETAYATYVETMRTQGQRSFEATLDEPFDPKEFGHMAALRTWQQQQQQKMIAAWRTAYRPFAVAIHEGDPTAQSLADCERDWARLDSPEYQVEMTKWRERNERRERKRAELEDELEDELDAWDDDADE